MVSTVADVVSVISTVADVVTDVSTLAMLLVLFLL